MLKLRKCAVAILVLSTLLSVFVVVANAGNIYDQRFVVSLLDTNYTAFLSPPQRKVNSSRVYFYPEETTLPDGVVYIDVSVYGTQVQQTGGGTNVTLRKGSTAIVPYVSCVVGYEYGIHNRVLEDGYKYVYLGLTGGSDEKVPYTVEGVWSADSSNDNYSEPFGQQPSKE